jgi:hypothetical protein
MIKPPIYKPVSLAARRACEHGQIYFKKDIAEPPREFLGTQCCNFLSFLAHNSNSLAQYNNEAEFVSGPRIARKRKKEIAARLLSFVYILRAYTKFGALLVAAARRAAR